MPAPAGYVGYTVLQMPVLQNCVNTYVPAAAPGQPAPPAQPPSVKGLFDKAAGWVQQSQPGGPAPPPGQPGPPPGFGGGFSFFECIIQVNNLNGAKPVPANHVIMARVHTATSKVVPCNTPPKAREWTYYEKFDGTGIDFQSAITGCATIYCFSRTMEYAILPDPAPAIAMPAGEHAAVIQPTPAQIAAFDAAITLQLTFHWDYDGCNPPTSSVLQFDAETLDPAQGGRVTWTVPGGPLVYSNP